MKKINLLILKCLKWPFVFLWRVFKFLTKFSLRLSLPYYFYRYYKGYRFGNIKCPSCNNWIKKPDVFSQKYLGKKIIQKSKTDVHYVSKGYIVTSSDRIIHNYKEDKEVDYYRNDYKCPKCSKLFYLDEY